MTQESEPLDYSKTHIASEFMSEKFEGKISSHSQPSLKTRWRKGKSLSKKKTSVKVTCKEREEMLCGAADSRRAQLVKLIGENECNMPVNEGWRQDLGKSN